MKNGQVMTIKSLCAKVAFGLFWQLAQMLDILATFFQLRTSNLFRPSFRSVLVGKPIFRLNGHILVILGPKTLKQSQK